MATSLTKFQSFTTHSITLVVLQLKLKNSHASYPKKLTLDTIVGCYTKCGLKTFLHIVGFGDSGNGMLQQTLAKRFGSSVQLMTKRTVVQTSCLDSSDDI